MYKPIHKYFLSKNSTTLIQKDQMGKKKLFSYNVLGIGALDLVDQDYGGPQPEGQVQVKVSTGRP